MKSDSLETALIGVKIAYLGKPYITLCIFFFVVEFCKVNLPDLLKGALVAFHLLITTLVFTCDLHSFFIPLSNISTLIPTVILFWDTVSFIICSSA